LLERVRFAQQLREMSGSPRQNNPFEALLPRLPRESSVRDKRRVMLVKRAPEAEVAKAMLDGLDGFALNCAEQAQTLEMLIARLPCSADAGTMRIERLITLGALLIWEELRDDDETLPGLDVEDPHTTETVRPRKP
jgi:hypothetical protein